RTCSCRSKKSGGRVCGGERTSVAGRRRARSLQNDRRRENMEIGFESKPAARCEDRLRRCRARSAKSRDRLRRIVRAAAHAMEFHLRSHPNEWRRCRWNFQEHEWWIDMEKIDERHGHANRPHRSRRFREQTECRDGDRAKLRRRHQRHQRIAQPRRWCVSLGRWRRTLDAHERDQLASILLQPDPDRSSERSARLLSRIRVTRLGRRRKKLPRRFVREVSSRLSCHGDPTRERPPAETRKTGRQKQATEAADLSAHLVRHGWWRVSKFCRRKKLGPSEQNSVR